jgi:Na+/proline symporter
VIADETHVLDPTTGWILLTVFGLIWIGLGIMWGRKAKDSEGFMLAGRNVGLALGAATAMATWVTSNTTMLAPVFALEKGVWGMLAYSTASFGLFLFAPLAFRIHKLIPKGYTSGDFVRLRFGRVAWGLFLLITLFYSLGWLVTMAIAGGELFLALAGIDYVLGMSVILFVCVVYTLFGGLFAVIGTDFIQSLVILVGIVFIGFVVLQEIDLPEMHASIREHQPGLLNLLMPAALLSFFNNMFFGFGEVFHNNVWWSRAFAMRRKVAPKAFFISGLLWFPIPIAAGFIALSAGPLGINIVDKNMTGPLVASQVMSMNGSGTLAGIIIFIVLFCSLASSIDSLLAATSDLITEDIYRKFLHKSASERQMRRAASFVIIGVGTVGWLLALPNWPLEQALFFSGPLVASVIWPVIGGLYWKSANRKAAALAMLLGSVIGLWAYFAIGWFTASLISAAVSMLVMSVGSKLFPESFDWSRLDETASTPSESHA